MFVFHKHKNLDSLVEGMIKASYEKDDLINENAYLKLDKVEKMTAAGQAVLAEFSSVSEIINRIKSGNATVMQNSEDINSEIAQLKKSTKANRKLYEGIQATHGDFTKVKEYHQIIDLIKYSKSVSDGNPDSSSYIEAVNTIEEAIKNMVAHKDLFKKAISDEAGYDENTLRLVTEFYISMSMLIILSFSVLYATSTKAKFDPINKKLENIKFIKSNNVDEAIVVIEYFNFFAKKGLLRNFLMKTNAKALKESLDGYLNENFLDVAFSIILTSKIADSFLLFPIYIIRYVIYLVMYLYEGYSTINDAFQQAIELKGKKVVTTTEMEKLERKASSSEAVFNQASIKSQAKADSEIGNSVATVQAGNSDTGFNSNVMI